MLGMAEHGRPILDFEIAMQQVLSSTKFSISYLSLLLFGLAIPRETVLGFVLALFLTVGNVATGVLGYAAPPAWREQLDGGRWIGFLIGFGLAAAWLRKSAIRTSSPPAGLRRFDGESDASAASGDDPRSTRPPPLRRDARDQREPEAEAARRTRHEGAKCVRAAIGRDPRATIVDLDRDLTGATLDANRDRALAMHACVIEEVSPRRAALAWDRRPRGRRRAPRHARHRRPPSAPHPRTKLAEIGEPAIEIAELEPRRREQLADQLVEHDDLALELVERAWIVGIARRIDQHAHVARARAQLVRDRGEELALIGDLLLYPAGHVVDRNRRACASRRRSDGGRDGVRACPHRYRARLDHEDQRPGQPPGDPTDAPHSTANTTTNCHHAGPPPRQAGSRHTRRRRARCRTTRRSGVASEPGATTGPTSCGRASARATSPSRRRSRETAGDARRAARDAPALLFPALCDDPRAGGGDASVVIIRRRS